MENLVILKCIVGIIMMTKMNQVKYFLSNPNLMTAIIRSIDVRNIPIYKNRVSSHLGEKINERMKLVTKIMEEKMNNILIFSIETVVKTPFSFGIVVKFCFSDLVLYK